MVATETIYNVIVGTAGHIDHGKSSLVQRLTGIDPDRLEEEKRRGMTIDLGFAPYEDAHGRLVGLIDVPGHERFIKNMVAGATSVDVMVLVVAADDGVMPQTREHLQIMEILGLERGMIAVTKKDLVDPDLLEMCLEDIRAFVQGTFLEDAPIMPLSSISGEGIDEFKAQLQELIDTTPPRSRGGLFRMPVQRVFSSKGQGTVLTGVPVNGEVAIGQHLEILPGRIKGKVRGIQAYKRSWETASAGHSTALNLTDVDYRKVERGRTIVTPGYFEESEFFLLKLHFLDTIGRPIKNREPVRFHVGTAEVMGSLALLEGDRLDPGESMFVQVRLDEPLVAIPGDRFLIRRPSPMTLLGGGVVIGDDEGWLKRRQSDVLEFAKQREEAIFDLHRSIELCCLGSEVPKNAKTLAVAVHAPLSDVEAAIEQLTKKKVLVVAAKGGGYLHGDLAKGAIKKVVQLVMDFHKAHPLRKWMDLAELRSKWDGSESMLSDALERGGKQGSLGLDKGGKVRASNFTPLLTPEQEQKLDLLCAAFAMGELAPPSLASVAESTKLKESEAATLVKLLSEEGELIRIGDHTFHRSAIEKAEKELVAHGKQNKDGLIEIPVLRDALGTSRKYMIPLLEHFDSKAVTVRRGDKRYLRSS